MFANFTAQFYDKSRGVSTLISKHGAKYTADTIDIKIGITCFALVIKLFTTYPSAKQLALVSQQYQRFYIISARDSMTGDSDEIIVFFQTKDYSKLGQFYANSVFIVLGYSHVRWPRTSSCESSQLE